jgi:hypothetical protein
MRADILAKQRPRSADLGRAIKRGDDREYSRRGRAVRPRPGREVSRNRWKV